MVKLTSHQEIARKAGGRTVVDVYECDSGAVIVTNHIVDASGVAGLKTCTCICSGTVSVSKTCSDGTSPLCDCSDPKNPKLTC